MYGGWRPNVWQTVLLGAGWIALGIVLHVALEWRAPDEEYRGWRGYALLRTWNALKPWLTVPVFVGLYHWWRAYAALHQPVASDPHAELGLDEPAAPEPPSPLRPPPLPAPPRLGDDPFRDPPRVQIAVVRHESKPAPIPLVPGDPDDKPKLLS